MLELKKDIKGPGYYWRAGMRKTKEEWQKEFPHCNFDWNEWFVDPEAEKAVMENMMLRDIVNGVFEQAELYSSSYREAAYACLQKLTEIHNKRFESMIHQIDTLTTALAAKDAEIERLKALCVKQFDDMMEDAKKQGVSQRIIDERRPQYIKENNLQQ